MLASDTVSPAFLPCCSARAITSLVTDETKERHAVSALVQRSHKALVAGHRRQTLRDVRGDLGLRERIEHDLLAEAVKAQLVPYRVERLIGDDDLGEPKLDSHIRRALERRRAM